MRAILFNIFLFSLTFCAYAQKENSVEALSDNATENVSEVTNTDLSTEKINLISPNRKIFILSNKSSQLGKGDFVSLVFENNLVCRALVAKTTDNQEAGIKILKIYSLKNWNKLKENAEVQIIRGDDSYFNKTKEKVAKEKEEKKEDKNLISDEDDLYNQSVVLNDGDFEENTNRVIKPDNIFGMAVGQIAGYNAQGGNQNYTHFLGHWAYQFHDNFWLEGVYGQSSISDFPDQGKDTKVTNYIARLKYTVTAPFYSYILPYLGYQYQSVSSPDAGKTNSLSVTQAQLDEEVTLTNKMKKTGPVIGITVLKRLVPGWFVKADLGTDLLDAGFCLEF